MANTNELPITFSNFNEFIDRSFEDLCNWEQTFILQSSVECYIQNVQKNSDNVKKLIAHLVAVDCMSESYDKLLEFSRDLLSKLEKVLTIMIDNMKPTEYCTPQDRMREDLYSFLLHVDRNFRRTSAVSRELAAVTEEALQTLQRQKIEKIAMGMMMNLSEMDIVDTGIFLLKEEIQKTASHILFVMNKYKDKLR